MLEIGMNAVVKNYGFKNILNGLSLEIMTGERVAIVGRNGSGKSTILKIIAGQETVNQGIATVRRGATVGYLEQIPQLLGQEVTTRDVLMEPFEHLYAIERRMRELERRMAEEQEGELERVMRSYAHQQSLFEAEGGYDMEESFSRISAGFGLTDWLDRPFNVLSGGQKTIVSLAKVLLMQPDILLLDEPTNHLDMRTLEWFEEYLSKYRGTVVVVSHDRYFLDKAANKTIILHQGKCTAYAGNYSYSVKERERQLLIEFEHYKNQQKKIEAIKAQIKRYRTWAAQSDNEDMYAKAKELEHRLERMEKLERPEIEAPKLTIGFTGGRVGRDAIKAEDVTLAVGGLTLLQGVSFTVFYKERACLLGDNGTGKTTLVRALNGDTSLYTGKLAVAVSAKVGYIPQEIRFTKDDMRVVEAFREEFPCPEGTARGILARFFFYGENVFKRVSSLSGGEKVLLKLAVLMQRQINLLILDEPTNHIDIQTREMLEQALSDFDGTILFISHDRYFVQKLAGRILAIEDGKLRDYACDFETYREYSGRIPS